MRSPNSPRPVRAVLLAGLVAGVLDIAWAAGSTLVQGGSPARMLRGIASGLLGKAALDGGAAASALGLAAHFTIALGAATTFYLLSRRLPWMLERPLVSGALFGVGVYLFMYRVVIPLSAAPWSPVFDLRRVSLALGAHLTCVGWPIAFVERRLLRGSPTGPSAPVRPEGPRR